VLEHLEALGGDLGADPVARDHGKLQRLKVCGHATRLVVVRALATVVSQVKRGLHGLL
jgi:hypothetical protein